VQLNEALCREGHAQHGRTSEGGHMIVGVLAPEIERDFMARLRSKGRQR
jgi:hypothetical protein